MNAPTSVPARFVFIALYAAVALVVFDQLAELAVSVYPFRIHETPWRFAAVGLATGRATILVLVDALLLIAALGRDDVVFLRVWAVIHLLLAAIFLVTLGLFALDALELRRNVRPEGLAAFGLAAARAATMTILSIGFCGWAGVAALRAARRPKSRGPDQVLVMGKTGS